MEAVLFIIDIFCMLGELGVGAHQGVKRLLGQAPPKPPLDPYDKETLRNGLLGSLALFVLIAIPVGICLTLKKFL